MRWSGVLALACALPLYSQQNAPHIGYVYPAGARAGAATRITVGGQFLDGVTEAVVSGAGLQASMVGFLKPMTPMEVNQLREQVQALADKRKAGTLTVDEQKTLVELREKLQSAVRQPASPAIAEQVTLEVTAAPNAAPGARELRLLTPTGVTNPLAFHVDRLPEFSKSPAPVIGRPVRPAAQPKPGAAEPPVNIALPAIVNGQIMPGRVDRYRFTADKGQHLMIAAKAQELIPYISDAVPGWFQATLALYDADGKQLAYADRHSFHPDPVIYYEIPADGSYTLAIQDSIFRGREDFVYRIAIGELPYLTGIFPLGAKAGAKAGVELLGWNLPAARVTERTKKAGLVPIAVRKGDWTSNALSFAIDTLPEVMEKEPNDDARHAQKIKLPAIVNGRIDRPGDEDVFRFDGRAGEEIVAEVYARRLDSPLDSILRLTDATGKQLAVNDDFVDRGAALITHQADSRIAIALPAKGTYYLYLGDTEHHGGREYAYRLRISHPMPDFEVRVAPSSVNLKTGVTMPIEVHALRRDGFSGEISLRLVNAPPGLVLSGAWIPANQDDARVTLTAPSDAIAKPVSLHLEARAEIGGREVVHQAVPAEDMMQAFYYHHLVPAKDWLLTVTGPAHRKALWSLASEKTVRLPVGKTVPVRVVVPGAQLANQVRVSLNDPPEGIAVREVTRTPEGIAIVLAADGKRVKPGLQGNLVLDAFREPPANAANPRPNANRRQALGTLPAVPFEVVAMN